VHLKNEMFVDDGSLFKVKASNPWQ